MLQRRRRRFQDFQPSNAVFCGFPLSKFDDNCLSVVCEPMFSLLVLMVFQMLIKVILNAKTNRFIAKLASICILKTLANDLAPLDNYEKIDQKSHYRVKRY